MIKTRFAPSPTGFLHIGGLRTALYAYCFARQKKGHLILRIEDTDQTRFVEGAMESLIRTLRWAGIEYDEGPDVDGTNGPYIQSQRTELYQKQANVLLEKGKAYRCFCSMERLNQMREEQIKQKQAPMYDKKCLTRPKEELEQLLDQKTPFVIRLNVPKGEAVRFRDIVRGDLSFDSDTLDDQVLMKSDGFPTYHLANVVDDHFMEITHVIRAEEWLPSTPKHILLYKAFEWEIPQFAHLPLILNKDKTKLSKRQNDVAVEDYIEKGYLKDAIINFIALLGWHPGSGETEEIFSIDQLIEKFDLEKVHKAGAVFDLGRLNWVNAHYIRQLPVAELAGLIYPWVEKTDWFKGKTVDDLHTRAAYVAIEAAQSRMKTLGEAPTLLKMFLVDELDYDPSLLENPKMNVDREVAKKALAAALEDLRGLSEEDFESEEKIKECLTGTIARLGLKNGQVLWPVRAALSGEAFSPGAFEMAKILGKERTVGRIERGVRRMK